MDILDTGCWIPSALGMICNQEGLMFATITVGPLALDVYWSLSGRVKGKRGKVSGLALCLECLDRGKTRGQGVILPVLHSLPPALSLFKATTGLFSKVDSTTLMALLLTFLLVEQSLDF